MNDAAVERFGPLIPPQRLSKLVGSGTLRSYVETGRMSFRLLKRHAALKPTDRIVEAGCGCGRIVPPLTRYLTSGSYDGFDIMAELIDWARDNITARHPNFRFRHVDLYNDFYNPEGKAKASTFDFPYASNTFDLAVTSSLFTHLLDEDTTRYLAEIARTLRPGGTAVMSFFILNRESQEMIDAGRSMYKFAHDQGRGVRIEEPSKPAAVVAYAEDTVRALVREHGLELYELLFGLWCGRKPTEIGQDYVLVRKPDR